MTWPTKTISEWELYFSLFIFLFCTFEMEIIFLFGFVHTIFQPMSFSETFSIFHLFYRLPLRLCHFGLWLEAKREKKYKRNNKPSTINEIVSTLANAMILMAKLKMICVFFFHSFGLSFFFGLLKHFLMKNGIERKISKWRPPAGLFNVVESFFSSQSSLHFFLIYRFPQNHCPDGVDLEFLFSEIKVEFICAVNKSSLKMWIRKKFINWTYR